MHVILFKDIRYNVPYAYICFDTTLLSFGYYDQEFHLQKEMTLQEFYEILTMPAQKKGSKTWKAIYYRNPSLSTDHVYLITETKFSYFGFTDQGQWLGISIKDPTEKRRIDTFAGIKHYVEGPCYEKIWPLEDRLKYPNAGIYPPNVNNPLYMICVPSGWFRIRVPFWIWLWQHGYLPLKNGIPMDQQVSQDRFVDFTVEKNKQEPQG